MGRAEFLMKNSSRSRCLEWSIKPQRKKFHFLENFNIFVYLFILEASLGHHGVLSTVF